jgi:large subunit ribosomal protein L20
MARVKRAVSGHKKRRKIMKLAKGYFGARSKKYRAANETVIRALRFAYIGRKLRKRDFRKLWIARINAATRVNGMSYSRFMNGLKKSGIEINRKMLSEMAINDAVGFAKLVETAKKQFNA